MWMKTSRVRKGQVGIGNSIAETHRSGGKIGYVALRILMGSMLIVAALAKVSSGEGSPKWVGDILGGSALSDGVSEGVFLCVCAVEAACGMSLVFRSGVKSVCLLWAVVTIGVGSIKWWMVLSGTQEWDCGCFGATGRVLPLWGSAVVDCAMAAGFAATFWGERGEPEE